MIIPKEEIKKGVLKEDDKVIVLPVKKADTAKKTFGLMKGWKQLDSKQKIQQGESSIMTDEAYFFDSYALIEVLKQNEMYKPYINSQVVTTKLNLFEIFYSILKDRNDTPRPKGRGI